jgi:branched-chain amino acid transport system permease protein
VREFFQYLISGLAVGSVYGLVALGFVLIFKSTRVFNFAQGDLVMVGAYLGLAGLVTAGAPLWLASLGAVAGAALLGLALQRVVFKPMLGQPLLTMVMVTIALSLILRSLTMIVWGPDDHAYPATLPRHSLDVWGVKVSTLDLIVMAVAGACVLAFALFFQRSRLGLHMRAMSEDAEAAAVCGVDANRVFSVALVIGTVTAALGGLLLANLQIVSPQLAEIGLLAFPAAIIGGMTSVAGAVVGGLIIGVLGQLSTGYVDSDATDVVVYGAVLLVLLARPHGLFGHAEAVRV